SDLHNTELGKDNKKLIQMLEESTPDIIAITGDLIDASDTDIEVALSFAEKAMQIAPCYYVTGNHEASASEYGQLRDGLLALGVVILENQNIEIERGSEVITVIGVNEPSFQPIEVTEDYSAMMNECLNPLVAENTNYKILLSHRPELFQVYVQNNIDLVLSGHAHGGQFRIPFIGGLVAPNQGILPTYDAGVYTKDQTNMVVSRGIGNSIIPIRFNNRPEIILIELLN
ncbi:MAG: metallophosphoesterase, partial [Lachnospira sp.]|nr:metallophosphoesterase [Lachnospira sp.]